MQRSQQTHHGTEATIDLGPALHSLKTLLLVSDWLQYITLFPAV